MPTYEDMTDTERRAELARLEQLLAEKQAEIRALEMQMAAAAVE